MTDTTFYLIAGAVALQAVTLLAYLAERSERQQARREAAMWREMAVDLNDEANRLTIRLLDYRINSIRRDPKTGRYLKRGA